MFLAYIRMLRVHGLFRFDRSYGSLKGFKNVFVCLINSVGPHARTLQRFRLSKSFTYFIWYAIVLPDSLC